MLNSAGIHRIARRHGFDEVDPSVLSFADQVRLLHGAEVITGVGGATFANLLFCRPGARVVGLVSNQLADFSMQSHLAHIAGAGFTYATGPSIHKPEQVAHLRDQYHADFRIPRYRYHRALKSAIQTS